MYKAKGNSMCSCVRHCRAHWRAWSEHMSWAWCAAYNTMCRSIWIQLYQNEVDLFEISASVDTQWTAAFREVALEFYGVVDSVFAVADVKSVVRTSAHPNSAIHAKVWKRLLLGKMRCWTPKTHITCTLFKVCNFVACSWPSIKISINFRKCMWWLREALQILGLY